MSRRFALSLHIAVTVAVMGLLVALVDVSALVAAAREADVGWLGAAALLLPLNLTLGAWKWQTLVRLLDPATRYRTAFGSLLAGHALALLTPLRLGDYAGRALYLPRLDGLAVVALTFIGRLLSLGGYVAVGLAALLWAADNLLHLPPVVRAFVTGLSVPVLVLLCASLASPARTFALGARLSPRLAHSSFAFMARFSGRLSAVAFGQSLLRFAVFSTQFAFLIRAFAPSVGWADLYVGVFLIYLLRTVTPSLTLFDLGIREAAAVFVLSAFDVSAAAAVHASLLTFALNLVLPAFAGALLIPSLRQALGRDGALRRRVRTRLTGRPASRLSG